SDITVDEFNRMRSIKLSDQSQMKLHQREQEIRQSEQDLEVLLKDLKSQRSIHEKMALSASKNSSP
ncbi:MAG: hypothetical protein ACMG6E_06245, partial [Candidatus Roizmanbacteria bacterium]